MADTGKKLILYYEICLTSSFKQVELEIYKPDGKTAGLNRGNIDILADDFISAGWRIDTAHDRITTIEKPIILNQFDAKPWRPNDKAYEEKFLQQGFMRLYEPLTGEELKRFYWNCVQETKKRKS